MRVVALKVLPMIPASDAASEQRFGSEVRVLAQLAVQPHIVTIYSMGITDKQPWIAMEYCEQTLAQKITDQPADAQEVQKLLEQVLSGLTAMHALTPPLVHQDLKPANILVDKLGNYKITDFSLASDVAAEKTHVVATVRYAAPELLSREFGKVGPTTDLYALGHIAYELALGGRAYRAQFPAVYEGQSNKEAHPAKWMSWHCSLNTMPATIQEVRKDFPEGLSTIIAKLMNKQHAQRFGSATEVAAILASLKEVAAVAPVQEAPKAAPAKAAGRWAQVPPPPPPSPSHAPEVAPELTDEVPEQVPETPPVTYSNLRYYVRMRGRVSGPFDVPTLQRMFKQGHMSRLHQVSTDQITWSAATTVEGLFGPTIV